MLVRIPLISGLMASLALFAQAPAQASDRDAAIAGVVLGAIVGGVIVSQSRPTQVYAPPPAHYPPPAYYPPHQVYYERQPVYYQQVPVYYVQEQPRQRHWQKQRRHHGHGHGYDRSYRW